VSKQQAPTEQEFLEEVGPPTLSFALPLEGDLEIPKGLLDCCRVTHQVTCEHFVARSVLGALWTIRYRVNPNQKRKRYKTVEESERVVIEGDILTQPSAMLAQVRVLTAMIEARLSLYQDAKLTGIWFHVWSLQADDAERFRYLSQWTPDKDRSLEAAFIKALPITLVDRDDLGPEDADPSEIGTTEWVPVDEYPRAVMILDSEIGHDGEYRYITRDTFKTPPLLASAT